MVKIIFKDSIRDAGQRLIGCHDYRNFCKMDIANGVVEYVRSISAVEVDFCDTEKKDR